MKARVPLLAKWSGRLKPWPARFGWGFALGFGLWFSAPRTQAFVSQNTAGGFPLHWNFDFYDPGAFPAQNPSTLAIPFYLSTDTASAATRTNEWNAVRAAFAQWSAVTGTKVRFEDAGTIPGPADVNLEDSRNTVVWFNANRSVCGGNAFFPSNAAALTCLAFLDDGTLVEADMMLNRSLNWFTDYNQPNPSGIFLESVVLHEVGHLLGLNHSPAGGATMFWLTSVGLTSQAGLSADEIAAVRALYGTTATQGASGILRGTVTRNGSAVFGAVVVAEDGEGNLAGATVTTSDGKYAFPGLPPGAYALRTTPLDPNGTGDQFLVRGFDLDEYRRTFNNADITFLPATNSAVTLTAGATLVRNLTVAAGTSAFRVVDTRPSFNANDRTSGDFVLRLRRGQTGASLGVYVPGLSGTTSLRLTGGGVVYGATQTIPNALRGLTLVQVNVDVAANAVPGLRSLALTAGANTVWVNGFVEILPDKPDDNFDGLDDTFQRRWFAPFTRSEAGPLQDPDGDGWINRREAAAGSNPTSASSVFFQVLSTRVTAQGTVVTAEAAPGKRFQLLSRSTFSGGTWQNVGAAVLANAETVQFTDPASTSTRFYRVQQVP